MNRAALGLSALMIGVTTCALAQSPPFSQIERGRYLAAVGDCVACHTVPGKAPFSGGLGLKTPFGVIYSTNLTPDPKTGLADWTRDDLWRVLHDGHGRHGENVYPAMPYAWTTVATREDSDAIFDYLKTLPPVENKPPANALIPPLNFRISVSGWNFLFFSPKTFTPNPEKSEIWNRGAYLVTGLGHCGGCHTPLNGLGAAEDSRALQGATLDNWFAPDITGDPATGLGSWSLEDIALYLKTGRNSRAIAAGPMSEVIMDSTQHLADDDLTAIATYLKDLKGASTRARTKRPDPHVETAGMQIFRDNCAACHAADGAGASQLIPSLVGDGVVSGKDPVGLLHVVLKGAASNHTASAPTSPDMPAFGWKLTDAEVAALATYLRATFGNEASPVDAESVRHLRARLQ